MENASFSGVYTPEEIESCNSLELKLVIDDSDKFVVIESELPFDENAKSVEMLMKNGTLLDLVRWSLGYEKHLTRVVIGEKLPSIAVNSSSPLEMGKFAY